MAAVNPFHERALAWEMLGEEARRAMGKEATRPDMDAIAHQLQIQYGIQVRVIDGHSAAWKAACFANPGSSNDLETDVSTLVDQIGTHDIDVCTLSTYWVEREAIWGFQIGDARVADVDASLQ